MMQTQSMRIKMKTERYTLYMNDEYNIRLLDTEEIKSIYNEHIVTDFPASEVKPLKQMLEKRENGQYFVYGLFESNTDDDGAPQEELSGYAYFIKCRNMGTSVVLRSCLNYIFLFRYCKQKTNRV